jgi:hypothetical protein
VPPTPRPASRSVASYHHRPDRDCWIVRVYDPTTKRERSRTFGKGVGAREAAKLFPAEAARLQAEVGQAVDNRGTVREYAERWLRDKRRELSPTTMAGGYEVIVARIVKQFGRKQLADLTRSDVRNWYETLRQQSKPKLSETTIERHHQVLRAISIRRSTTRCCRAIRRRRCAGRRRRPQA